MDKQNNKIVFCFFFLQVVFFSSSSAFACRGIFIRIVNEATNGTYKLINKLTIN